MKICGFHMVSMYDRLSPHLRTFREQHTCNYHLSTTAIHVESLNQPEDIKQHILAITITENTTETPTTPAMKPVPNRILTDQTDQAETTQTHSHRIFRLDNTIYYHQFPNIKQQQQYQPRIPAKKYTPWHMTRLIHPNYFHRVMPHIIVTVQKTEATNPGKVAFLLQSKNPTTLKWYRREKAMDVNRFGWKLPATIII